MVNLRKDSNEAEQVWTAQEKKNLMTNSKANII